MRSRYTLEEICSELVDCVNRTAPESLDGDHYLIGTPAMRDNTVSLGDARRVSSETFARWTRRLRPVEGDLLLAREAPVGPVIRIPAGGNFGAGQRTTHLRANPSLVHPRFLFYLLVEPTVQARLLARSMGSTVPHLRVADVKTFAIPELPSLVQQQAIAEILGALDDKIESNSKIIQKANSLADSLFVQVATGLPFSTQRFCDVATVSGGGTPKTSEPGYWNGNILWATPTDITALKAPYLKSTSRTITESGLASCASILHPPGSILMTSRATIGTFALTQVPTAVNQGFIVVNSHNPELQLWIYHEMKSRVVEFISHANGATFLELSRGRFKELKVRLPARDQAESFNLRATALHRISAHLSAESTTLTTLRDTLLPHLISGKISVRDAEKQIEHAL